MSETFDPKKKWKKAHQEEVDAEDDEDVDSELYGDESVQLEDDQDEDDLEKLAESSDDVEMQQDDSDIDSDEEEREIIKVNKSSA